MWYTGAPDECSIHWPTKYNENGDCPKCVIPKVDIEVMRMRQQLRVAAIMHSPNICLNLFLKRN